MPCVFSKEKRDGTYRKSACSRNRPTNTMGVPVDAPSAPEMSLVDRLSIIGLTAHVYGAGKRPVASRVKRNIRSDWKETSRQTGARGESGKPVEARVLQRCV